MSIGSVIQQLRQRYQHGLSTAHYRDAIAPRILYSKPVLDTTDLTGEIHLFTSQMDWVNAVWALKSFYYVSQRRYALCIHEDGSLTPEQIQQLQSHFPRARVVDRATADAFVFSQLAAYPRCLKFRQTNLLSPKVFDFLLYLNSDRLLLLDSDVLFFQTPTALLHSLDDSSYSLNLLNRDIASAYTVEPETAASVGVELRPRLNSGLGLIHRRSLNLAWLEEFLELPNILRHVWRTEQTLYALCSSRFGVEWLPPAYDVRLDRGIGDSPCRHYVGKIRHLFYAEGLRHLVQRGFLKELEK